MYLNKEAKIDFDVPSDLRKLMYKAEEVYDEKGGDSVAYILLTDDIEGIAKSLHIDGTLTYEQADLILFKYGM